MRRDLPTGTVTFLFTDVESSTRLLDELGDARYGELLAEHRRLCREMWEAHHGFEVDTAGDGFFVAFARATDAVAAAAAAQTALAVVALRVRIGVHTGEASVSETGYVGLHVHRAARITAAARGGQVLVSSATAALVGTQGLRDLGEHHLKDLAAPERLFQLGETEFPPLNSLERGGVGYKILGSLEAVRDNRPLKLGGSKQRAVLALLLLNPNRVVSTDELIEALWPEKAPGKPQTAIQGYVSDLRKILEPERKQDQSFTTIATEPIGYRIAVGREILDLFQFEDLVRDGRDSLGAGRPHDASAQLEKALALWRGPPLADFRYEQWAQAEIGRLEELRLAAVEERVEADLALGRHTELVGELDGLVAAHPLREPLRAALMLALYRSGRQSEALNAYQDARRALVDEFGIDPSRELQELERQMLRQDPALDLGDGATQRVAASAAPEARSILVLVGRDPSTRLLAVARALARSKVPHELILARMVDGVAPAPGDDLGTATAELHALRVELAEDGVEARIAAFTSGSPGEDAVRLASEQSVDLLLVQREAGELPQGDLDDDLSAILEAAPCDVAVLVDRVDGELATDRAVGVAFGGTEHDWAALELAAWIAGATDAPLRLLGVAADPSSGGRDASRLLAAASLAVQSLVGVPAEPILLPAGWEGLLQASADTSLLIAGAPGQWREHGLGEVRGELARSAVSPMFLVRRGVRPGGLAPRDDQTRFTWSLADARPT